MIVGDAFPDRPAAAARARQRTLQASIRTARLEEELARAQQEEAEMAAEAAMSRPG